MNCQHNKNSLVSLDIIIPVFNEQSVLPLLFETLEDVFSEKNLDRHGIESVRCLFVDDGSADKTAEMIAEGIRNGFPAELYRLSRNFGHQAALSAGLNHADADIVAIIDADLQDPPAIIFEMIAAWRSGFDIVYGIRQKRKESLFKTSAYWIFYRVLAWLSDVHIPKDAGDFCIMDRQVVDVMRTIPEHLRFHRGMRAWVGFRQKGIAYERSARGAGKPKYSFHALYALATDGLAWSSIKPLKIGQLASFAFTLFALILGITASVYYLHERPVTGLSFWLIITNIILLFGFAVISLCLYIISAYIGRTYLEAKSRPTYIVMEHIGGDNPPHPAAVKNPNQETHS